MGIIRFKGINYTSSADDVSDSELNYESGDELNPSEPAEVPKLNNKETLKTFAQKVSTAVKNVRYLLKMLGTTDISAIGDGTTTGAIKSLKEGMNPEDIGAFPGTIEIPDGADLNECKTPGVYSGSGAYTYAHSPVTNRSFTLIVFTSGLHTKQIMIPASGVVANENFVRQFHPDYTDWTEWSGLVTQVKGSAETDYRGGLVNLTPENIGALSLENGGIVNNEVFLRKGSRVITQNANPGNTGYVVFMRLKITQINVNYPIYFILGGRGFNTRYVTIVFRGVQNLDPDLDALLYFGWNNVNYPLYIRKTEASTWELCTKKLATHGSVSIYSLANDNQPGAVEITYPNNLIKTSDFVASEWTEAQFDGKIKESVTAEQLSTLKSSLNVNPVSVTTNYIGYANSPSIFTPLFGFEDGGLIEQYYSSKYAHQIYEDYRTGQIAVRGNNSGTWQPFRKVVDHLNYDTLIPAATTSKAGLMSAADKLKTDRTHYGAIADSNFATNFRTEMFGSSGQGDGITTFRANTVVDILSQYAAGLAFGTADTHAYINVTYDGSNPVAFIGGGNGNKINWAGKLVFLLDSYLATASKSGLMSAADKVKLDSIVASSSRKYKKNIAEMDEEEAKKLLELVPVRYDYINQEDGTDCYGLIAEDVAEVMSYPVVYVDGEPDAINYSKFVPYLIKMVQVQDREIEELRNAVGNLHIT